MNRDFTYQKIALLLLLFTSLIAPAVLKAQGTQIFSRFDFNGYPLVTPTIGPEASYVDPDAITDGSAMYMQTNCISLKGFDLTIPVASGIFDQPEMGMTFRFQRDEAFANFFNRGNTAFYIQGGILFVQYQTSNNGVPTINGPYATNFSIPNDDTYREYTFIYTAGDGVAEVLVDGNRVWRRNGPNNRPLDWRNAGDVVVGQIMDGTCQGMGVLDYAYFFVPQGAIPNLPVEFTDLWTNETEAGVQVNWQVASEVNNHYFTLERSVEGETFEEIAKVESNPANQDGGTYHLLDEQPKSGFLTYRIRQTDLDGSYSYSETVSLNRSEVPKLKAKGYPNPAENQFHLNVQAGKGALKCSILDLQGMEHWSGEFPDGTANLDLPVEGLPKGVYYVVLTQGVQKSTTRLLKN